MHLLYLVFGQGLGNHVQAHFSILTFLSQRPALKSINILTDNPEFYASLNDHVKIIAIDTNTLKEWKGAYDFFWRTKIKAIEMLCNLYKNEPVLYLDSDTFLYGDLQLLNAAANAGQAFMHENEGKLSTDKSKTAKKMWKQIGHVSYEGVVITEEHHMWNAGVVLTPNKKDNQECLRAINICDAMCRQGVTRRLIEQYALSVALQETYSLQPAAGVIGHYWSNKENWNKAIEHFLLTASFKACTTQQSVQALEHFNFSKLPIKLRVKNTNTRLKALVEKLYPPKGLTFIETNPQPE